MDPYHPLRGIRVVEFESIGPGPVAGRILAGMGATVTLIARPEASPVVRQLGGGKVNELERGKQRLVLDIKNSEDDRAQACGLITGADVLIEGLRPGVMERLGFGPAACGRLNPRLIYGRMTGWGQTGPLANAAGHDINYVALSGVLSLAAYRGERPVVPPTVVGDSTGALGLAFGIVCALLDARATGKGRVVDAAIIDILAMQGMLVQFLRASGMVDSEAPSAFHDSPFYDVYECADGGYVTIGALEPQFYAELIAKLELTGVDPRQQYDARQWPALKERLRAVFKQQTREDWCRLLEYTDVCFAPVLSIDEAARHPQNMARGNFILNDEGSPYGATAPRYLPLGEAEHGSGLGAASRDDGHRRRV